MLWMRESFDMEVGAVKILGYLFMGLGFIGYAGNGLLMMYIEYLYIRADWFNLFNPLIHLMVLWDLVRMPLAWILLAFAAIGYFGAKWIDDREDRLRRQAWLSDSQRSVSDEH